jgi:hypothetical protein
MSWQAGALRNCDYVIAAAAQPDSAPSGRAQVRALGHDDELECSRSPLEPGSASEARCGAFGVQYGPSVCRGASGACGPQAGVSGRSAP